MTIRQDETRALARESLTDEELLDLFRRMAFLREFEERTAEQYAKGRIWGFCHLYTGQEAVAVGAMSVLTDHDYVVTAYRDHGQAIAKGVDPKRVMAELFGRRTGTSLGRGGSMHLFDTGVHFMGGYAIVGGGLPIASGLALSVQYKDEDRVVASFFGEGAVAEGAFHESLNLAQLWKLPIIFIIENNLYGMGTAVERASATRDFYTRAEAYDMPGEPVDGMDVLAVRDAVGRARRRARAGKGPTLLEMKTYRFRPHSMSDPARYRTRAEVEIWRERDPLVTFPPRLVEEGIAREEEIAAIRAEVAKEVEACIAFAEESPHPEPDDLMRYLWAGDEPERPAERGERERSAETDEREPPPAVEPAATGDEGG
ncbi:MAG TPA: pyruvate dehydrogenase (acetyl-transferring) E1 component subunit alpha [Gemmatimonadota bacterium]